jgi:glycosyltransferase involved in cell wall biosynthesis
VAKSKLRILHLIASNFVGGPERQILHHADNAASPSLEIWVGSFRTELAQGEILRRAQEMGLPTLELSSSRFDPRTIFELAQLLRQKQITLVCSHGYKANLVAWAASRLAGCTHISFVRGWTAETWKVKLYECLDRLILRRADWVVCVSQALAEQAGKKRRGRRAPIVIPNAALFLAEKDVASPVDRRSLRRALGLPENAALVCTLGRLSAEKGHRYLLQCLPGLVSRISNLRIVLLGEGRERSRLEAQLVRSGMQNYVIFAGFRNDVRPWIQACDVIVNPSLTEGMPNVLLEAMALGTAVVATRVGGVPDLIEDRESGLLVPPSNASALANAICDLFADPAEALRLSRNAQARVQEYAPARQCQRLLELYAKALEMPEPEPQGSSGFLPHQGRQTQSQVPDPE